MLEVIIIGTLIILAAGVLVRPWYDITLTRMIEPFRSPPTTSATCLRPCHPGSKRAYRLEPSFYRPWALRVLSLSISCSQGVALPNLS